MLREQPRNPLLVQVLSLYLLLLAFFVVLNTISRVEEARQKAVTGSLNETFAAEGIPVDRTRRFVSNEGDVPNAVVELRRLGDLISTELALAKVEEIRPGRLLQVTIGQDELFVHDRAAIDPPRRRSIESISAVLSGPPATLRYEVELLAGADTGDELTIARTAYLADVMVAAGADRRGVLAGLVREDRGNLTFRFHLRPKPAPRSRFFREDQP